MKATWVVDSLFTLNHTVRSLHPNWKDFSSDVQRYFKTLNYLSKQTPVDLQTQRVRPKLCNDNMGLTV